MQGENPASVSGHLLVSLPSPSHRAKPRVDVSKEHHESPGAALGSDDIVVSPAEPLLALRDHMG